MGITEDIADELAQEALAQEYRLDDESIVKKVSETLGATSTTTQEAFLTAIRVRRSQARALKFLAEVAERQP
ncbi:MAG: hypothetical protein ABJ327_10325 [Litoreibacter sp.]